MGDRKYAIEYDIKFHKDGVTVDELGKGNGACDNIVIHSIIGTPGGPGPLSVMTISRAGATGEELTPKQLFIIWTLMTKTLVDKLDDGWRKDLCVGIWETIVKIAKGPTDG